MFRSSSRVYSNIRPNTQNSVSILRNKLESQLGYSLNTDEGRTTLQLLTYRQVLNLSVRLDAIERQLSQMPHQSRFQPQASSLQADRLKIQRISSDSEDEEFIEKLKEQDYKNKLVKS